MLRHAAEILNLKVHKVKENSTGEIKEVPVPIDLEGIYVSILFSRLSLNLINRASGNRWKILRSGYEFLL